MPTDYHLFALIRSYSPILSPASCTFYIPEILSCWFMKYVSFILLIADSSEFHFSFFHFVLYFFMTKQTGFCRSVLFLFICCFSSC